MSYYFVLSDREFRETADEVCGFCHVLESALDQYGEIAGRLAAEAIPSGAVHDALERYNLYISRLRIVSRGIGEKFSQVVNSFIADVEAADSYLYVAGLSTIRDFSQEEYEHLKACLDDTWCAETDSIGDWLYGKFLKIVDFFHWDSVKEYLQGCHRLLLDLNDETLAGLNEMFSNVHSIDSRYGQSVGGVGGEDFYTSRLDCAALALYGVRDMLAAMADIIEPGKGRFTVQNIEATVGGLYTRMLEDYLKFIAVPVRGAKPTLAQIEKFASKDWAKEYFSDFDTASARFVSELGGWDAAMMVLFKMFGISRDVIAHGDYETYIMKLQLMAMFGEMVEEKLYADTGRQEALEDFRTLIKYVKKYGKDFYKYLNTHRDSSGRLLLDGRTIPAKRYKQFLDGLDRAGDILKYGDKGLEILETLLTDYTVGLEALDAFERNFGGDEKMAAAIEEIRGLYEKQFSAYAEEVWELVKEFGVDKGLDLLSESPVMAVVKAIEETIDVVGDISGLGDKADSMYEALTHFNMSSETEAAYRRAVEKFQAADPDSEEYQQLAEDVEYCFDLHKKNLKGMFDSMAKASDGSESSYYRYIAGRVDGLSMDDTSAPDILSYDEYLKVYDR